MKLYIAGPMRGYPFFNFAEFDRVRDIIRELGHEVISPADLSRQAVIDKGLDPNVEASYGPPNFAPEDFMETDIQVLRHVDGIVLLTGWSYSKGTAVEIAYARYRDIPVYSSVEEFELLVCVKKAA